MNIILFERIYIEFRHRLLIRKNELDTANIKWSLDEAAGQLDLAYRKLQKGFHHGL